MAETKEVHFLMMTAAMLGHLNPMLKLAKRLVSEGIRVTIAVNDVARNRKLSSSNSNLTCTDRKATSKHPAEIDFIFFSDGISLEFNRDDDVDLFIRSMRTTGKENLSNIISDLSSEGKKISCIIFNPFFPWMADIAEENGIPCATLWIQASSIYSIYYNYFKNPDSFPSFENPDALVEFPGLPVLQVKDLPSFVLPTCPPIFYETLTQFVQKLDKIKWVLGSSFNEIEENVVKSIASLHPIYPIGPLVSPFLLGEEEMTEIGHFDMWNAESSCMEWLDKQAPSSVIYISFGSITVLSQKQMDNLAMGLKNSNKPFLWVIKPQPKSSENKGGELSDSFLEETKEKGLVVKWCEQEKVLMHKSVGCFITHCGWNSAMESVVAGVPVITYPGWTDQPTVAKLLVDVLKIGVRLRIENGVASAEDVESCIKRITDGHEAEEIKQRALELKEAARNAVAEGGSSDHNINQFIREIAGILF